jgi:hypothetical protein
MVLEMRKLQIRYCDEVRPQIYEVSFEMVNETLTYTVSCSVHEHTVNWRAWEHGPENAPVFRGVWTPLSGLAYRLSSGESAKLPKGKLPEGNMDIIIARCCAVSWNRLETF